MSEVRSTFRLTPGDPAPAFSLPDPEGKVHTLADVMGPAGTLVVFACNHCPYVIHLAAPLRALAAEMAPVGISTVAINSNDIANYPQDRPALMKPFAAEHAWSFPYLFDESQDVALAYGAACTPDFFLLDGDGRLFYTGQFDSTRPNDGQPADGRDLRDAIRRLLAGQPPPVHVYPSSGCNIKWKAGRQPAWWDSGNHQPPVAP